jgi:hypothetical protein
MKRKLGRGGAESAAKTVLVKHARARVRVRSGRMGGERLKWEVFSFKRWLAAALVGVDPEAETPADGGFGDGWMVL